MLLLLLLLLLKLLWPASVLRLSTAVPTACLRDAITP
jgi:hypothetical protein